MRSLSAATNASNSQSSRRAAVALFRTSLKLIRDLERQSTTTKTTALGERLANLWEESAASGSQDHQDRPKLESLSDLRDAIRTAYRQPLFASTDSSVGSIDKNKDDNALMQARISAAIRGVSQLDQLVPYLKQQQNEEGNEEDEPPDSRSFNISTTSTSSSSASSETFTLPTMEETDDWATEWIDNNVDWLPPILDMTQDENNDNSNTKLPPLSPNVFPLFPLSGPFYQPGLPLPLFSSDSYRDAPLPGDVHIQLQIFEPRYREMYQELIVLASSSQQDSKPQQENETITDPSLGQLTPISDTHGFVVPFAHPTEAGRYAKTGLLYQLTHVREVADETQGVVQYIGLHSIHGAPVRLDRILNPQSFDRRDTYLRVQATHAAAETDDEGAALFQSLQRPTSTNSSRVLSKLQDMMQSGHAFADKALHALQVRGHLGFLKVWNSALQERLLQTELKLAAQFKILKQQQDKDTSSSLDDLVRQVQQNHRKELLSLQLETALTLPRLLQCSSEEEQEEVLVDLAESESKRKPFPRR